MKGQDYLQQLSSPCRLFGVLFRLLRLQVSNHIGSAQLTEDSLWVFVRIALTYLSVNVPAGTDCTRTKFSLFYRVLRSVQ